MQELQNSKIWSSLQHMAVTIKLPGFALLSYLSIMFAMCQLEFLSVSVISVQATTVLAVQYSMS